MLAAPAWAKPDAIAFDKRTETLLQSMNDTQKEQFATIKMGHSVRRAVEHTQETIFNAVKSCKKHNPSLKPELDKALKEWKSHVSPVSRKAHDRVEQMIKKQTFAKPLVVRSYLKEYDDLVKARQGHVTIVPVTAASDCENLMTKMNDLDDDLIQSLDDVLQLDKPL